MSMNEMTFELFFKVASTVGEFDSANRVVLHLRNPEVLGSETGFPACIEGYREILLTPRRYPRGSWHASRINRQVS